MGYRNANDDEILVELILENENINNWSELFTLERFDNLIVSAKDFVLALQRSVKKNPSINEVVRFQILEQKPNVILDNSFIAKRPLTPETINKDEYNIGCVLKGESTIYYCRYSCKNEQQFNKNKNDWIKRFSRAYIGTSPLMNQEGRWFTFTPTKVYDKNKLLQ